MGARAVRHGCHKNPQFLQLRNADVNFFNFCMFRVSHLIPLKAILFVMSHIVEMKADHFSNVFIVKFHQNQSKGGIFEMMCFFLRSV